GGGAALAHECAGGAAQAARGDDRAAAAGRAGAGGARCARRGARSGAATVGGDGRTDRGGSMNPHWTPHARKRDLIVKRVEGELLVYDTERHRAHSLAPLLAALWKRCDGKTTVAALAAALATELHRAGDEGVVGVA